MITFAFYLFAISVCTAGFMVVLSRNPVHSVLWLILAFIASAGLFVLQGAEFVAMLLVIVYVGAVAVLFLFVVMMLDVDFAQLRGELAGYLPLAGLIGRSRRYKGQVLAIDALSDDILSLTCRVEGDWHHRAGQFAFLTADRREGAHPFTVSGADDGTGRVEFSIKALGDYTRRLQKSLKVGQAVTIEGPYGCFDFERDDGRPQIWVAAGIGVTPFISWLESLQAEPARAPNATLYYCVRNADEAPFAERLKTLCAHVPNVTLKIRYSDTERPLSAAELAADHKPGMPWPSVWFCGPIGFADALKDGLHRRGMPVGELFHQEAFQMR